MLRSFSLVLAGFLFALAPPASAIWINNMGSGGDSVVHKIVGEPPEWTRETFLIGTTSDPEPDAWCDDSWAHIFVSLIDSDPGPAVKRGVWVSADQMSSPAISDCYVNTNGDDLHYEIVVAYD